MALSKQEINRRYYEKHAQKIRESQLDRYHTNTEYRQQIAERKSWTNNNQKRALLRVMPFFNITAQEMCEAF